VSSRGYLRRNSNFLALALIASLQALLFQNCGSGYQLEKEVQIQSSSIPDVPSGTSGILSVSPQMKFARNVPVQIDFTLDQPAASDLSVSIEVTSVSANYIAAFDSFFMDQVKAGTKFLGTIKAGDNKGTLLIPTKGHALTGPLSFAVKVSLVNLNASANATVTVDPLPTDPALLINAGYIGQNGTQYSASMAAWQPANNIEHHFYDLIPGSGATYLSGANTLHVYNGEKVMAVDVPSTLLSYNLVQSEASYWDLIGITNDRLHLIAQDYTATSDLVAPNVGTIKKVAVPHSYNAQHTFTDPVYVLNDKGELYYGSLTAKTFSKMVLADEIVDLAHGETFIIAVGKSGKLYEMRAQLSMGSFAPPAVFQTITITSASPPTSIYGSLGAFVLIFEQGGAFGFDVGKNGINQPAFTNFNFSAKILPAVGGISTTNGYLNMLGADGKIYVPQNCTFSSTDFTVPHPASCNVLVSNLPAF
jgi:hypothetical protein